MVACINCFHDTLSVNNVPSKGWHDGNIKGARPLTDDSAGRIGVVITFFLRRAAFFLYGFEIDLF